LLVSGDEVVLAAPVATFRLEIERIKPPLLLPFRSVTPTNERLYTWVFLQQTADADLADLQAAIHNSTLSADQCDALVADYGVAREALRKYAESRWASTERMIRWEQGWTWTPDPPPQPQWPQIHVPKELPAEFAYYLRGAIAYHRGRVQWARTAWQRVLNLPPEQRHYRSTWAAFMIGKTCLQDDPSKTAGWFARVRELASQGFSDSLGLAASSLGWEAQVELDRKNYERAIELYLAQNASGDPTAMTSLLLAAGRASRSDPPVLERLARHATARQVITAYIISRESDLSELTKSWLAAIESVGTRDMAGADRFAWAAYKGGDMEAARRWLDRATDRSPTAQWVRAKLLLREGKMDAAAKLLAKLVRNFPDNEDWSGAYKSCSPWPWWLNRPTPQQVSGELGVLQLARGQYADALDLLLRGGYGLDAAYVAERVLAPNELIAYVNRCWPKSETA
jgi:tetratricopeptide (TPR) repeat protein